MRKKERGQSHDSFRSLTWLQKSHTIYPAAPDSTHLNVFPNPCPRRDYWIEFDCPEFTSLCPVTSQPDFGHIIIRYIPNNSCIESKSLKVYLFSYRNFATFHEAAVNRILDDLYRSAHPRRAVVKGLFRPRGGIAITVEACHPR